MLRCHQRPIAQFIHAQMQNHYWEDAAGYEVKVSKGFTELKDCAYTALATQTVRDFRNSPSDKSNMAKYVFGGFERCLYPVQKFQSDSERRLAIVADRESQKWFKPAKGQFQIFYLRPAIILNTSLISWPRPTARSTCWSRRPRMKWRTPT